MKISAHFKRYKNKTPKVKFVLVFIAYLIANITTIIFQFIPGMITFIFWGAIAPLFAIIASWIQIKKTTDITSVWIVKSSAISSLYLGCGFISAFFISELWASV